MNDKMLYCWLKKNLTTQNTTVSAQNYCCRNPKPAQRAETVFSRPANSAPISTLVLKTSRLRS